jgi:low molecular weight protein-tyrosine phosphatase
VDVDVDVLAGGSSYVTVWFSTCDAEDPVSQMSSRFRILFVCSDNICRSPLAEILTRRGLNDRLGPGAASFTVASAGTIAVPGTLIDIRTRHLLGRYQLESAVSAFRATALERAVVADADLVLTAEQSHRAVAVEMYPQALGKTFCLLEFTHLLAPPIAAPLPVNLVQRARTAVLVARRRRGTWPFSLSGTHDIPEPTGRPAPMYRQTIDIVGRAVEDLVDLLAGTRATRSRESLVVGRQTGR